MVLQQKCFCAIFRFAVFQSSTGISNPNIWIFQITGSRFRLRLAAGQKAGWRLKTETLFKNVDLERWERWLRTLVENVGREWGMLVKIVD